METNIEIVDQDVERIRMKYGDKEIPKDDLKKFKVSDFYHFRCLIISI